MHTLTAAGVSAKSLLLIENTLTAYPAGPSEGRVLRFYLPVLSLRDGRIINSITNVVTAATASDRGYTFMRPENVWWLGKTANIHIIRIPHTPIREISAGGIEIPKPRRYPD